MKFSFALFATTVLATQTVNYVTVNRTPNTSDKSCIKITSMNVPSTSDFSVEPAIRESFKNFGVKTGETFETTVEFKTLDEEVRGTVRVQSYDISVTLNGGEWVDSPHVNIARSRALLQIVGTLNLFHPNSNRPWKSKINIFTNAGSDPANPKFPFSRPSNLIKEAKKFALTPGCKGFPE